MTGGTMDVFKSFKAEKEKSQMVDTFFTPSKPVSSPTNLRGRDEEIGKILGALTTPGMHCMIYGDRGIGKSSLALSTLEGGKDNQILPTDIFQYRCIKRTTFKDIIEAPAVFIDRSYTANKIESTQKYGARAKLLDLFSLEGSREEKITIEREELTANKAASLFQHLDAVLLIDEFDVVSDEVKHEIAEFVKQLSDANSPFKVLIVGIGSDGEALIAGHQSVIRCMHEIKLPRVEDKYLEEIITNGEGGLGLVFERNVKNKIIEISSGFPYFTHLLCKECAEEALRGKVKNIGEDTFKSALIQAVKNTEGQLKRSYDIASTSSRTDMYPKILLSAAKFNNEQFTVKQWIEQISIDHNIELTNGSMNNYTGKLTKPTRGNILTLVRRGAYKITDPRMPSYILMCHQAGD
ncbi:ATP-binding protein [Klebsiella quasipneumoniae]|nr:ATP-binding protein [Klebsiella variicola]MBU5395845.1 ATP-binding protein [Klebsiella quasipneumoniae]HBQ5150126.1 ATP-binding protein [Klebsiella pneumoniae]HBQ5687047.1 ATP-binding protein [Klebsiella pneumoniae subsp. pneumoniae]HBX6174946.1 ATP-binding protein [Klebsiella pneumoniae]